jgi:large subunit ribosomal protein L18e
MDMHEREDLKALIGKLQLEKKGIWKRAAELLSKPRRRRVEVNVGKIGQYAPEGATVLVPGKVLGTGKLNKKITVAAFMFSDGAKKALLESGAKAIGIEELFKQNPEGKSVFILI